MAGISADQLRRLFAQEAEGRILELGRLLRQLEQTGGDEQVIRSIYREFHTVKGSAAVSGLSGVSRIAHDLEELANTLRVGGQPVTPEVIKTLLVGVDQLSTAIRAAQNTGPVMPPVEVAPRPHAAPTMGRRPPAGPSRPREPAADLSRLAAETIAMHQRLGRVLKERFNVDSATFAEFNEQSRLLSELQDCTVRTQLVPVSTVTDRLYQVVSDLARAQGKQIRWQALGTDTEMDKGVLHQLSDSLMQLVRNAVDHGIEPPEERIRTDKRAEGTIRLRAMQLDSDVVISVTDDGRGLQGSSRGAGLDLVRANVEAAHGRVEVQCQPGAGSEYRLVVPLNPQPTPPPVRHRRILVVDDALIIRELQRAILVRAGFEVRVATDGNDALASLAEAPSDLVLTDLQMPNMGGYALTAAIKADPTLTHIPVLILSSGSTDEDRQRGLDAGANGYLEKGGFDEASLLAAVSELLGANA